MDPNEIIRPQEEKTVWVYTQGPNIGQVATPNHKDAQPVIRTTVYRKDGRVEVWQRRPDQGAEFGMLMPEASYTDEKIAAQFEKDKAQAEAAAVKAENTGPPGGKPYIDEDGPNGRRLGWNPETRAYDRDIGSSPQAQQAAAAAEAAATGATVRTPEVIDGKPYIKVTTKKGNEQETYYTDEGGNRVPTPVPASATTDPVGKPTGNTRQKEEGGQQIKETEYVLPDGKTVWRTQTAPAAASTATAKTPQLSPDKKSYGYFDNSSGSPVWVTLPPDQAPPLPGEPDKPPVQVEGVYGEWKRDAEGNQTFVPVQQQPGAVKTPEGAPDLDLSTPETAHSSFLSLYQWVDGQVRAGKMTPSQAKSVLEAPHNATKMVLDRETTRISQGLTQRGQDVSLTTNALSNATSQYSTASEQAMKVNAMAGPGSNHGMGMLLGGLALQNAHSRAMGGLDRPPPVIPGPLRSLPPYPGAATAAAPAAVPAAAAAPAVPVAPGAPAANAVAEAEAVRRQHAATGQPLPPPLLAPPPAVEPVAAPTSADPRAVPSLSTGEPINAGAMTYVNRRTGQSQLIHPSNLPFMPDAGDWEPDGSPPVQMGPMVAPTMALASAFGGGADPYAGAMASIRALGIGDDDINEAWRGFMAGG